MFLYLEDTKTWPISWQLMLQLLGLSFTATALSVHLGQ
jgi:hypothetical protein